MIVVSLYVDGSRFIVEASVIGRLDAVIARSVPRGKTGCCECVREACFTGWLFSKPRGQVRQARVRDATEGRSSVGFPTCGVRSDNGCGNRQSAGFLARDRPCYVVARGLLSGGKQRRPAGTEPGIRSTITTQKGRKRPCPDDSTRFSMGYDPGRSCPTSDPGSWTT